MTEDNPKDNPKPGPERAQTDQSLGAERNKTDRELAETRARLEESADEIVEKARTRADQVVKLARQRADDRAPMQPKDGQAAQELERVRTAEDAALRGERAAADVVLLNEETARRDALAALLEVEREHTDLHLSSERHRSDDAVDARDQFLAMVTHDLRTFLGGVAMEASLIAKEADESATGARLRRRADNVRRYVSRMSRLVADLVDVASIEAGKLHVVCERNDGGKVFGEAVEAFLPLAGARGIALDAEIGDGSLEASFDHDRVLQVLANLINNAIKFTASGGKIRMRIEPNDAGVRFSVADTGPGIPRAQLDAVFERFRQLKSLDRSGLGLGLFIAKCIVDAHGGRIWCESTEGVGSTFHFTLPAIEQPPTQPGASG